jgi:hypothetical protein
MRRLALIAPALVLLSFACSGGGESEDTTVVIGDAELVAMAEGLTNSAFGDAYANMVRHEDSGLQTQQAFIEESNDPADEAKDVERFGYVASANYSYLDTDSLGAGGPLIAEVGVVLFETEEGATGFLRDDLEEGKAAYTGTTELGVVQSFETFQPKVGEEDYGVFIRVWATEDTFGFDSDLTLTVVSFQRGRVVGTVVVMRADARDAKSDAVGVTKQLDKRIQAIMRGEKPAAPAGASGR